MTDLETIETVREHIATFRSPGATLFAQLKAKRRAREITLAYVQNMGHANVITAQRLARLVRSM
jgi:hypothetical protein